MNTVYVIIRHTGMFSDYRSWPIAFTTTAEAAQEFVAQAEAAAEKLKEQRQEYWDKINEIDTEAVGYKKHDRLLKKMEKLRSEIDHKLEPCEADGDLSYSFMPIERFGAK